jgi:glutamate racemase
LLRATIEREARLLLGPDVEVVDSAHAAAREAGDFLASRGLARIREDGGSIELLVTDMPKSFAEVAGRFLGQELPHVEQVDL